MTAAVSDADGRLGTGIISSHNFVNRVGQYYDVGGIALFEGDINLGTTDELEAQTASGQAGTVERPACRASPRTRTSDAG